MANTNPSQRVTEEKQGGKSGRNRGGMLPDVRASTDRIICPGRCCPQRAGLFYFIKALSAVWPGMPTDQLDRGNYSTEVFSR